MGIFIVNDTFAVLIADSIARELLDKDRLEHEEASKQIAFCQGEVAGIRNMISLIIETELCSAPFIEAMDIHEVLEDLHRIDEDDFIKMVAEIRELTSSRNFKIFEQKVSEIIESKKNYLFYSADKGRDLDFIHGFRDGILRIRTNIADIKHEEEERAKKMPLFDISVLHL